MTVTANLGSKPTVAPTEDASQHQADETEKQSAWIVRKLVGSMTGRIVTSAYESLRATGTTVVCLSPWGDSSPVSLPCIRFRDLVVHTVVAATGGVAAVAAPVMEPVADVAISSMGGDSILVEALVKGVTKAANSLVIAEPLEKILAERRAGSLVLETSSVKVLLITLKYMHAGVEEAVLGFYRSSMHEDSSMFSAVKDYLRVEKGWFAPYLFASARRPDIPRAMKPDVIFCHGPFLQGDYRVGETLLGESVYRIALCDAPPPPLEMNPPLPSKDNGEDESGHHRFSVSRALDRLHSHSSDSKTAEVGLPGAPPAPPLPRRMVVLLVGLKPHRKLWTTSKRPGESVIKYVLCDGCPAVVVPARREAPLVAWDGTTLGELWRLGLSGEGEAGEAGEAKFEKVVMAVFEFLDLCVVEWERVVVVVGGGKEKEEKREAVKDAVRVLVAAAVKTRDSKEVKKEVDEDRCGIAMWRIP